jgi:hypothetical protein
MRAHFSTQRQQLRAVRRKEVKMDKARNIGIIPSHKMIIGDDKERARQCSVAIQNVLNGYDCIIIPQLTLTHGNVSGAYLVQAIPRIPENGKANG